MIYVLGILMALGIAGLAYGMKYLMETMEYFEDQRAARRNHPYDY